MRMLRPVELSCVTSINVPTLVPLTVRLGTLTKFTVLNVCS